MSQGRGAVAAIASRHTRLLLAPGTARGPDFSLHKVGLVVLRWVSKFHGLSFDIACRTGLGDDASEMFAKANSVAMDAFGNIGIIAGFSLDGAIVALFQR